MPELIARDLSGWIGWAVSYLPAKAIDDLMAPVRRTIVVDAVRGPWEYRGVERVGLTERPKGGIATEYIVLADTPVTVVRPVRAKAKREVRIHGGDTRADH